LTEENSTLLRKLGESSEDRFVEHQPMPQMNRQTESDSGISEPAGEFFVPKEVLAEPVQETPNFGGEPTTLFNADKVLLRTMDKNDLTAIEGIGPFLEKKHNDAGVFTYADIAAWDAEKIAEKNKKRSNKGIRKRNL
jgi:predicted flap endonuclease-1-like 5' DNA nuclease